MMRVNRDATENTCKRDAARGRWQSLVHLRSVAALGRVHGPARARGGAL